eukprot:CAMPEP_0198432174 /NCGR_PEP_ID=MMETSP1452-20131203/21990_1 /TAXON_ID=1181717 /ORGANISM="Synchroma pusillum, Strain CCMP3072" /LENGTH=220 /DNA_ID=CAMNT_0044152647 /DNA_START=49 /DNA_END=707 /DNA_ORIENTATION=+
MAAPEAIALTYFPVRARAEPFAMLAAYLGVPVELTIVGREEWPAVKPSTPLGQLPVATWPGSSVPVVQSNTLVRALAQEHGLLPADPATFRLVDMALESAHELTKLINPLSNVLHGESFLQTKQEYADKRGRYFTMLSDLLGDNDFFGGGSRPTPACFMATHVVDLTRSVFGKDETDAAYPALAALCDRVQRLPGVSDYVSNRRPLRAMPEPASAPATAP